MLQTCLLNNTSMLFEGFVISILTAIIIYIFRYFYVLINTLKIANIICGRYYMAYGPKEKIKENENKNGSHNQESLKLFDAIPDYSKPKGRICIKRKFLSGRKFIINYTPFNTNANDKKDIWKGLLVISDVTFISGELTFAYEEESDFQDLGFKKILLRHYKNEWLIYCITENIKTDTINQNYGLEIFSRN